MDKTRSPSNLVMNAILSNRQMTHRQSQSSENVTRDLTRIMGDYVYYLLFRLWVQSNLAALVPSHSLGACLLVAASLLVSLSYVCIAWRHTWSSRPNHFYSSKCQKLLSASYLESFVCMRTTTGKQHWGMPGVSPLYYLGKSKEKVHILCKYQEY